MNKRKGLMSMLFSDQPRCHYQNAPVYEVICQLRFPSILSINTTEPAAFQEWIRSDFPQYRRSVETPLPLMPGAAPQSPPPPVVNYHFLSADGKWKLNLTKDFISLSTLQYSSWEAFARVLDKPLASFIQLYHPAFFQRVGLRYVNIFSRQKLAAEHIPWPQLLQSAYLSALTQEDVPEANVLSTRTELQLKLDSSCSAKIHAGLGKTTGTAGKAPSEETKFILDLDFFMQGQTPCTLAAASLETLHGHANRVFEGAITDQMRQLLIASPE